MNLTPTEQDFVTALEMGKGQPVSLSDIMLRMYGAPGRNRAHGILWVIAHKCRKKGVPVQTGAGAYFLEARA